MIHLLIIADGDATSLEKMLSGQVGFILATLIFGIFFWKVLLPRWDRQVAAITRLANAVKIIAITRLNQEHASGEEISRAIEELEDGEIKEHS